MYSYLVVLLHGKVKKVEFWEERPKKRFCKIRVERVRENRFYTSGDYVGSGHGSIHVTKSIEKAIEGFPEDVVAKCVEAFNLELPSLGDMLKIFPGAEVKFEH